MAGVKRLNIVRLKKNAMEKRPVFWVSVKHEKLNSDSSGAEQLLAGAA